MRQKLFSITQRFALPSICALCNQFHNGPLAVCAFCTQLIRPLGPSCQYCAHPLADNVHLICGSCIKKKPHFDRAFIPYIFEEPLRGLLHQFKYTKGLYLSTFLSHLMLQSSKCMTQKPECLIPVPIHPIRLRQRGFNQAAILTKLLAKQLQIPYDFNSCQKIMNTAPQASLNKEQRQKNLRHVFHTRAMPYQHVMLVDDLMTTGSTANELALTLKKSGLRQVDIWCCARTV